MATNSCGTDDCYVSPELPLSEKEYTLTVGSITVIEPLTAVLARLKLNQKDSNNAPDFLNWLKFVEKCKSLTVRTVYIHPSNLQTWGRFTTSFDMTLNRESDMRLVQRMHFQFECFSLPNVQATGAPTPLFRAEGSIPVTYVQCNDVLVCSFCTSCSLGKAPPRSAYFALHPSKSTKSHSLHLDRKHSALVMVNQFSSAELTKERLNQQVCYALAMNDLPFTLLNSESFRKVFLSGYTGRIVKDTQMFRRYLFEVHDIFRDELKVALADQVAHIGFDLWTSITNEPFLILSVYWIDFEFRMQDAVLSISPLHDHTAEGIVASVRKELNAVGLQEKKIFSIATDGASNEQAAATFEGFAPNAEHLWCFAHKINLVVGDCFDDRVRARTSSSRSRIPAQRSEWTRTWRDADRGTLNCGTRNRSASVQRIKEMCHELNISYLDSVVDSVGDNEIVMVESISNSKQLWEVARRIINVFRRSHVKMDLLQAAASKHLSIKRQNNPEFKFKKLVLYSRTRWVGAASEFASLLQYREAIEDLQSENLRAEIHLPCDFWSMLEEVHGVLQIFDDALIMIQSRSVPTLSWMPILVSLACKLIKNHREICQTAVAQAFCEIAVNSLETRCGSILDMLSNLDGDTEVDDDLLSFLLSTIIDPTTASNWPEVLPAELIHRMALSIKDTIARFDIPQPAPTRKRSRDSFETQGWQPPGNSFPTMSSIISRMTGKREIARAPEAPEDFVADSIRAEFCEYIAQVKREEQNGSTMIALTWWKTNRSSFPYLACIARILLGQPAGTADVERKCSLAGNIITKARNRIKPRKANALLCIRANADRPWAATCKRLLGL